MLKKTYVLDNPANPCADSSFLTASHVLLPVYQLSYKRKKTASIIISWKATLQRKENEVRIYHVGGMLQ